MNSDKNAKLTLQARTLLIKRIVLMELMLAAQAAGISLHTGSNWRHRFEGPGLPA